MWSEVLLIDGAVVVQHLRRGEQHSHLTGPLFATWVLLEITRGCHVFFFLMVNVCIAMCVMCVLQCVGQIYVFSPSEGIIPEPHSSNCPGDCD